MATAFVSQQQNQLLMSLPASSRRRALSELQEVDLPLGFRMAVAGEPVECVYFLNSGIASVLLPTTDNCFSTTGIIGNDGFAPFPLIDRGTDCPVSVEVLVPGAGYVMEAGSFVRLLRNDRFVEKLFMGFVRILLLQTASTVSSVIHQKIEKRLARWLLMCHDRLVGNDIILTHDSLAHILGVRRASVTTALHVLEGNGFLRSTRGLITLKDRPGLEHYVGRSYGLAERAYRSLIADGSDHDHSPKSVGEVFGGAFTNLQ